MLLLLGDYLVAVVAGADRVTIQHIGDEDTPVAHLAGVRLAEQDLNGRLHEDVAADDRDTHALNDVGGVLHTCRCCPMPCTSEYSNQLMSAASKASFTSSNLVLRMIASIFFISI